MPELETKPDKREQPEPFYRPNESDRKERARQWIEQVRGKEQEPKN